MLKPGLRRVWRGPHTLQLGFGLLVGLPGAGTGFAITTASGQTITFSFVYNGTAVVVSATSATAFPLDTKSTEGSEKVTCG